jgi:hypothetical protein
MKGKDHLEELEANGRIILKSSRIRVRIYGLYLL